MKLVIVESPTKARTIKRFLGRGFKVESSYGHVRDLPKSTLGIDTENNFEPKYIIPMKSKKTVNQLKKEAQNSEKIVLATDEDREGEAIAWHLVQALGLNEIKNQKSKIKETERIVFHEITEKAIKEALKNPRDIDMKLVDSQQARRILDRLVGYNLSPFLWKKVFGGLSAGRVQSVAVRLIVEREREIQKFKSEEYWNIIALLQKHGTAKKLDAVLVKKDGRVLEKLKIKSQEEAEKIVEDLKDAIWQVQNIERRRVLKNPLPPFTTSTLQQEAFRRLGFSAKQTMFTAQELYEGMEIGEEGPVGLVTYMRTDSLSLSEQALSEAQDFLKKEAGENYTLKAARRFKTKSRLAQEAHEAIRPTSSWRQPESIKQFLNPRQFKLYELIWKRFLASQMPQAIFDSTSVDIKASNYTFRASGQVMKFDGFLKIYPMKFSELLLPELKDGEELKLIKLTPNQHFTEPPPRYTEASLVKTLENYGIGRPSTYAPIISTIQERDYVKRDEKKRLHPTEVGFVVNDLLVEHFPEIVDVEFTRKMEEELDEIASGEKEWQPVIQEFYKPFSSHIKEKYESVQKQEMTEATDEKCELCGKVMVIKRGRFGKFIACSGFPECKNTKPLPPVSLNLTCPKCREGEVVIRQTRRGKTFYGCSRYPKCDFASWSRPNGQFCPECSSPLVEIKNGMKCSSRSCSFIAKEINTSPTS